MKLDLKKKFDYDSNSIGFLNEKITHLLSENDISLLNSNNREAMSLLLRKIALKGFIRTHSFIVNWFREFFEEGVLTTKTFHEVIKELPWSWDQSKKYFDPLEDNNLIHYSRNSKGQKVCQLKINRNLKNETYNNNSSQNQRLFDKLKFGKKIPINSLSKIHQVYRNYYEKNICLKKIIQEKENSTRNIKRANKKEMENFIHEIVQAYFIGDGEEKDPICRIEMVLRKKPLRQYSLVQEGK